MRKGRNRTRDQDGIEETMTRKSDAGYRLDLQSSCTTTCFGLHESLPMRTQPRHVFDTITSRAQAYPSNASERATRAVKPNIIHHNQAPHLCSPPRALETPTADWTQEVKMTAMLEEQAPSSTTSTQQSALSNFMPDVQWSARLFLYRLRSKVVWKKDSSEARMSLP